MEEFKFNDYTLKTIYDDNTNIIIFTLSNTKSIIIYESKIDLNNFNNSNNVQKNYDIILKFLNNSSKYEDNNIESLSVFGNSLFHTPPTTKAPFSNILYVENKSKKQRTNNDYYIKILPNIGFIEIIFNSDFDNINFKIFLKEKTIDFSLIEDKLNTQINRLKNIIEKQKELFNELYKVPEISNIIDNKINHKQNNEYDIELCMLN